LFNPIRLFNKGLFHFCNPECLDLDFFPIFMLCYVDTNYQHDQNFAQNLLHTIYYMPTVVWFYAPLLTDRQSKSHSSPMTLAWHFTSDIIGLTLAPEGLQGDPPEKCVIGEFLWQASHTSDSVLPGLALANRPEPDNTSVWKWIALRFTTLTFLRLILLGLPGMFGMEIPLCE